MLITEILEDDTCDYPAAMEYSLACRYRFEHADPVHLLSVVRIENGVAEDALERAPNSVQDQLPTLENGGCN